MPPPLADRIALVTGASRGIGYATALALARAGAHVVAVARTVGGLEELDDEIRKLGASATLVPLDVKDHAGIARLAAALTERYHRLDVLIGNAGIGGPSWQLNRHFEPLLRASDAGRAVFISSGAAHNARAYRGPYGVSKAALEVLARTFAAETASTNIRVNIFNPGPTRTHMRAAVMPGEDPMTLPPVEEVAEKIVALALPSMAETGKLYDFRHGKLFSYRLPTDS